MHWFLKTFVIPLLDALRPRVIVEVGVELGAVTGPLLEWARAHDAALHCIDPNPKLELDELLAEHAARLHFHRAASLDVLPQIADVDLALIDGDHNWYTVINELRELTRRAQEDGRRPPVMLLHDIGWPYGRRDLYYDPSRIPAAHRQPHARQGIVPGEAELTPLGANAHLQNARLEGTPANGVLTAVEDFIAESERAWQFRAIPGLSGLGVLLDADTYADAACAPVRELLERIETPGFLRAQCEAIEAARLDSEVRRARVARKLAETELRLRAIDPEELVEMRERAGALEEQLRLVGELEDRLRASVTPNSGATFAELVAFEANFSERASARALREQRRLSAELTELRTELEHADAQRGRLQSALARARADVEVADGEREAIERRLRELTAARAASPGAGIAAIADGEGVAVARLRDELRRMRDERDELTHALALIHARNPAAHPWELELEQRGRKAFLDVYLPLLDELPRGSEREEQGPRPDPLAVPHPVDRHGVLCAAGERQHAEEPDVDVVVCVRDALADVRRCLHALLDARERRFRLILVDDGSAEPTRALLAAFAARHPAVTLIRRDAGPHGYTRAANAGLRASGGDYVVLLNSDTIVTPGWLARIVAYGERHPRVGILGPLSNAATHQSVPELREDGAWATNPLPDWLTAEGMALVVERAAPRVDARLPFLNGFCYVIRRAVIEAIGEFDEERFAEGYCEENDYSHRAFKHGWELAVVDDAYVQHAKSRSYGVEGRGELAKRHYAAFLDKHGREQLESLVATTEANESLAPVREAVRRASSSPAAIAELLAGPERPLSVVFVLPGLAEGGSGGSHSIYQEVKGMRALGIPARIALHAKAWERARSVYADAAEVFEVFSDVEELAGKTADADVISATHFKSLALLAELRARREDFLAAYYVQDYEPFFAVPDSEDLHEAIASYTALRDDAVLFAKTSWLCNVVGARHAVPVAKVAPSIDERLFSPLARAREDMGSTPELGDDARERDAGGPVRVIAMIRPRTPRRQPFSTLALLERALAELPPGSVEVATFGCQRLELARLTRSRTILDAHLGVLSRREVAEELRRADVFVDMSVYQAFGRSALEAMACGCTALVPELGGAWEFLEHGVNAIALDTLDPDAGLQALRALIEDRTALARMQHAARATGARYSVARAALSEYLLFEREHRRRFGAPAATLVAATLPASP